VSDAGEWAFRGLIEGFYGPPWSWDARAEIMRWCHERGMTHYVYAPKDDPLHRERWRERYPDDAMRAFEALVAAETLEVGFAISPGLSIDCSAPDDREALGAKCDQLLAVGVRLVCLALDDIPMRPGLGGDHAELTVWLREHLADRADLVLVPTEYTGTVSSAYLDALAARVPDDVPIAWTGATVVCDTISADDARSRAAALGGRRPFVWDNYPVNDAIMRDRLFLGPLRGRHTDLGAECSGYVANPMVEPMASKPALASVAAYLRGEAPEEGWLEAVESLGIRVFAEACDGEVPNRLVDEVIATSTSPDWVEPLAALTTWLRAAMQGQAPGLEDEAGPWIEQTKQEAQVALAAARVLQAIHPVVTIDESGVGRAAVADNQSAVEQALAISMLWPAARRGSVSVMGPRSSFRPVLAQWPDGEWRYRDASLQEGRNATDRLVRHASEQLDRFERDRAITVAVDHRPVELTDGTFEAPPGAQVMVTSGPSSTRVTAPCAPPLKDRRLAPPA
jgi:hypothetical protein